MDGNIIARGAEGVIIRTEDGTILKKRVRKGYRIAELDSAIIKSRTKREIKVIETLSEMRVPVPTIIESDIANGTIELKEIEGDKLRDVVDHTNYKFYGLMVGNLIANVHEAGIIHSDLTTSNMIVSNEKIFLLDFGLSFFSHKVEDMAVDLNLLYHALDSKHHEFSENMFSVVIEEYSKRKKDAGEVIERLQKVQLRGRNKMKFPHNGLIVNE